MGKACGLLEELPHAHGVGKERPALCPLASSDALLSCILTAAAAADWPAAVRAGSWAARSSLAHRWTLLVCRVTIQPLAPQAGHHFLMIGAKQLALGACQCGLEYRS